MKRWLILAVVLVAGCSNAAKDDGGFLGKRVTTTTSSVPAEAAITLTGDGQLNTEPFHLAGGSYTVAYDFRADCTYFADLMDPDQVASVQSLASGSKAVGGTSNAYAVKAGTYYVRVTTGPPPGCPWTLILTPKGAGAGATTVPPDVAETTTSTATATPRLTTPARASTATTSVIAAPSVTEAPVRTTPAPAVTTSSVDPTRPKPTTTTRPTVVATTAVPAPIEPGGPCSPKGAHATANTSEQEPVTCMPPQCGNQPYGTQKLTWQTGC